MSLLEKYIVQTQQQIWINIFLKSFLVGAGTGLLFYTFQSSWVLGLSVFFIAFLISAFFHGLFKNHKKDAIKILHQQFPGLEFSLELMGKKEKNLAESLQWERVNSHIPNEKPRVYQRGLKLFLIFGLLSIIAFGMSFIPLNFGQEEQKLSSVPVNTISQEAEIPPVELAGLTVKITPPSYTGMASEEQSDLEIKTIKGASITWQIDFSEKDLDVKMVNSENQELSFENQAGKHLFSDRAEGSGIYAIRAYRDEEKVFESAYFPFEVYEDIPPIIVPEEKEVYKFHFQKDAQKTTLKAKISDDFKVNEVYLVATLARGSGENVKFRESRIDIMNRSFQSENVATELDFEALGFQQGDELYYYWAAIDNKYPEPNFSSSDTYFIKYVDANGLGETELAGMAITVLPDYFRSQRQIIIDTEKLIAERKSMPKQTFNETSNTIGYDQKLLRLRYGQYLGEEFENSTGGGEIAAEGGDILASYSHAHDSEGEHEPADLPAVELPESSHENHSNEVEEDESGLGGLLNAFMHSHDSAEENTFFEESTKGALKMALEQMWQSELHLRLYEPEKALPYEKKALEYLKSVQQKSRVYVKRTGFDPPPIKEEEKRLSGDLEDLDNQISKELKNMNAGLKPLAAQILGMLSKNQLTEMDKATINEFGRIWTARMQYTGLEDWSVLLELQQFSAGDLSSESRANLQKLLYPIARTGQSLEASYLQEEELQKAFWKNIK